MINRNGSVFVIAEAGVNHNGSLELAKKLVDKAAFAKADAVKFQTFKAENLVTSYASMAKYQKDNIGTEDTQLKMLKKLELSYSDFAELKSYCDHKGILFLSTPFDFESADFLESINMEIYKISSGDLNNIPFLEYIAKKKKPIIISSGMSNLNEIEDAISAVKNISSSDISVLHCTSNYPARLENVNLRAMLTIKNTFHVRTGYSDHTEGITIPVAAAALGAEIIEKHFTLDKNLEGPDHKASLNPDELKKMIEEIRKVELSLGNGIKDCTGSELDTLKAARKSIVASRKIAEGEIITEDSLSYKRPGTGLSPKYYKDVIGKKAMIDIEKDEQIFFNILE